jgi:hypothetical protein
VQSIDEGCRGMLRVVLASLRTLKSLCAGNQTVQNRLFEHVGKVQEHLDAQVENLPSGGEADCRKRSLPRDSIVIRGVELLVEVLRGNAELCVLVPERLVGTVARLLQAFPDRAPFFVAFFKVILRPVESEPPIERNQLLLLTELQRAHTDGRPCLLKFIMNEHRRQIDWLLLLVPAPAAAAAAAATATGPQLPAPTAHTDSPERRHAVDALMRQLGVVTEEQALQALGEGPPFCLQAAVHAALLLELPSLVAGGAQSTRVCAILQVELREFGLQQDLLVQRCQQALEVAASATDPAWCSDSGVGRDVACAIAATAAAQLKLCVAVYVDTALQTTRAQGCEQLVPAVLCLLSIHAPRDCDQPEAAAGRDAKQPPCLAGSAWLDKYLLTPGQLIGFMDAAGRQGMLDQLSASVREAMTATLLRVVPAEALPRADRLQAYRLALHLGCISAGGKWHKLGDNLEDTLQLRDKAIPALQRAWESSKQLGKLEAFAVVARGRQADHLRMVVRVMGAEGNYLRDAQATELDQLVAKVSERSSQSASERVSE